MASLPLRVFLLTCRKYAWTLRPFSYCFNLFWSSLQPVVVGGFEPLPFPLPPNFTFHQIDTYDYPARIWSNGLIKLLNEVPDDYLVILFDDYWLCRGVDHGGVLTLLDYMRQHPNVVRFDLTADRLYGHMMKDIEFYGHYDIVECAEDAPYQFSFQAAIWNKKLLLELLVPDKSPWEVEIYTNMVGRGMRVLGSRQWPVRYANAMNLGKLDRGQIDRIPEPHRSEVVKWIPAGLDVRKDNP